MPDTIQGVLSARIDRFPEEHKRLLQTASVLGREFAPACCRRCGKDGPVEAMLLDLKHFEFLYDRPACEEPTPVFTHALTQEVAYDSLLTTRRQVLHAAAGHAMERLYPEWLAERDEELAYHFTRGAVWEKAFVYLAKAGEKPARRMPTRKPLRSIRKLWRCSRRITSALDDAHLLPIYEGRGLVWTLQTKYDEAIADFQQDAPDGRPVRGPAQEGESLCHLAYVHMLMLSESTYTLCGAVRPRGLRLAHTTGDPQHPREGAHQPWAACSMRGHLQAADRKLETSMSISRQEGYKTALAENLLGMALMPTGKGIFRVPYIAVGRV